MLRVHCVASVERIIMESEMEKSKIVDISRRVLALADDNLIKTIDNSTAVHIARESNHDGCSPLVSNELTVDKLAQHGNETCKHSNVVHGHHHISDIPPGGRRRIRSADDSALFTKKRKKRMVKKQVVGVIEDLENVIYEINSVTSELRGVLNQIDRVTSHLELSVDGLDISEDNIFLKSSRSQTSIQESRQRSASCVSLRTLSRYRQEINASTQTSKKHDPTVTRRREDTSLFKHKPTIAANEVYPYKKEIKNKQPTKSHKSKANTSREDVGLRNLQYCSQQSLDSSVGQCLSINGSLATSVSSMTGVLSSSLTSLNTGYNTSFEEIDFGICWRRKTSTGPCATVDSSYRTLSATNSLFFEDSILQNDNSFHPYVAADYHTNNIADGCTCDKEYNILGIDASADSSSLYRPIFSSTKPHSRSRATSVSDIASQVSCFSSEDLLKDFHANYDRDINTWTTFAMVHIDADELRD